MANDKLPVPATQADMYANAIVNELRDLNASIKKLLGAAKSDAAPDTVELKEPEKAKPTTRDAMQAADKVAKDAAGPVTVETVEVVDKPTPKVPKRN